MTRLLRILGASIAGLVLAVVLIVVLALSFEFSVPLDSQRERIALVLSDALGTPVRIEGPLKVLTGPRAGVDVARARIGTQPAESAGFSVDIGRLVLRIHLMPLFSRTFHVSELSAEDVLFCVAEPVKPAAPRKPAASGRAPKWRLQAIDRLNLERLRLAQGTPCDPANALVDLTLLEGASGADGRLTLSTRARIGGEDLTARVQGPALGRILARAPKEAFDLTVEMAGAKAVAKGHANFAEFSVEADVEFETAQFVRIIRPLGAPFKDFGPLRLRGRVAASRSQARIQAHEAELIPGRARADATFTWTGAHPSLLVEASAERLDVTALTDWLDRSLDAARLVPGRLTRNTISGMRITEGRLKMAVDELAAGPVKLSSAVLDGTWKTGEADASLDGFIDQAPLAARLRMSLGDAEHALSGTASLKNLSLPRKLPVTGRIRTVDVKFETKGALGEGLRRALRATVNVREAALSLPGGNGKRLPLDLEHGTVRWHERDTLIVDGRGKLAGRAIEVHLAGKDAAAIWQRRPWTLGAAGKAATLAIKANGTITVLEDRVDAGLDLAARAERLGPLAGANDRLPGLALEAAGRFDLKAHAWAAGLRTLRLGGTRGRANASGRWPLAATPFKVDLDLDALDLNDWIGPRAAPVQAKDVLPRGLALPAAELTARAKRVMLPGRLAQNVEIDAATRNGALAVSRFHAELEGARITGELGMDLTGAAAKVSATAKAAGLNETHFGKRLAGKGIRLRLGEVALSADTSGNRVSDLAANATVDLRLQKSEFSVPLGKVNSVRSGSVASARLSAAPQQPARLAADGQVSGLEFALEASSAPLARLLEPADAPIRASARFAGIDVALDGHLPGPRLPEHPLTVKLHADKLSRLEVLTTQELPSTGPLAAALTVRGLTGGAPSADFDVTLGESRLEGTVVRRVADGRAHWAADLRGPLLRLEDLGSEAWVATHEETEAKAKRRSKREPVDIAAQRERAQTLIDDVRNALRGVDVRLRAAIDSVRSRAEEFGRVDARVVVEAGRLNADPVSIEGPNGVLSVALDADYAAENTPFRFDFNLEGFNYGRLVNSIRPALDATGKLSAKLALTGRGKVGEIAPHLNGRAGLILFPSSGQGLRLLELWGGGLLRNVGLSLDPGQDSKVNCGVATFTIDRGVVKSQALMLDSTRVRAAGELKVDLASGTLEGLVMPKPKQAELFSARVPVAIGGTLSKPTAAPTTSGILVSAARYYLFAYAYLFDATTGDKLEADGSPDCIAAYRKLTAER